MSTAPAIDLPGRVAAVRDRIAEAGGDPRAVRLVAVTKGFDAGVVQEALDAGLVDIGESYVQELVAKATQLEEGAGDRSLRWHFVGRLQRNKVRKAAPHVWLWHSVDRLALGAEIARWAPPFWLRSMRPERRVRPAASRRWRRRCWTAWSTSAWTCAGS